MLRIFLDNNNNNQSKCKNNTNNCLIKSLCFPSEYKISGKLINIKQKIVKRNWQIKVNG